MWLLLQRSGIEPARRRAGLRWRQFLSAQAEGIVACDPVAVVNCPTVLRTCVRLPLLVVGTWEADDPAYSRPIAAPLERCVDLAAIQRAAADVEPYIRVDGSKVWSLMQLERRLRPEAYGRVRGGYVSRRRRPAHDQPFPQVEERGSERLEGASQGVRPST